MWANFHTHSSYCDGKTGLRDVLAEATSCKMLSLGFSSHAPLPFQKPWAMKADRLQEYLDEISSLKSQFPSLQVYAGLEIDFIPGKLSPKDFEEKLNYTIGSVHFVEQFDNNDPWEIDNTNSVFMDGLDKIFKGNVREAVTRYFELTREMIEESRPDVLGHMDKIKIQNINEGLFKEDEDWYREEVVKTIKTIKSHDVIVEVSTRGIYQKKSDTTYPSPWIIELLYQNGVSVMLSSDAHHPKDLTNGFEDAAGMLMRIGYKNIMTLHDGTWKPYRFDEGGLHI